MPVQRITDLILRTGCTPASMACEARFFSANFKNNVLNCRDTASLMLYNFFVFVSGAPIRYHQNPIH